MQFYPSLKKEIVKASFAKDTAEVMFKNGSRCTSLPINQASKGQRRHRGSIEESNIINHADYEDIVAPIFVVPRQTMGGKADMEELNGQIARYTTSGYFIAQAYSNVCCKSREPISIGCVLNV